MANLRPHAKTMDSRQRNAFTLYRLQRTDQRSIQTDISCADGIAPLRVLLRRSLEPRMVGTWTCTLPGAFRQAGGSAATLQSL